jgi:molecular chaperone GrpE (heat shock protein)
LAEKGAGELNHRSGEIMVDESNINNKDTEDIPEGDTQPGAEQPVLIESTGGSRSNHDQADKTAGDNLPKTNSIIEESSALEDDQITSTTLLERLKVIEDIDETLKDALQRIAEDIEQKNELIKCLTDEIKRKEELFERLYKELEEYKRDFVYENITKRLFLDCIDLYDKLVALSSKPNISKKSNKEYTFLMNNLLEILRRREVTPIAGSIEKFDPQLQKAIEFNTCENPEDDERVLEIIRRGFEYKGKLLRTEEVVVGKYVQREADSGKTDKT